MWTNCTLLPHGSSGTNSYWAPSVGLHAYICILSSSRLQRCTSRRPDAGFRRSAKPYCRLALRLIELISSIGYSCNPYRQVFNVLKADVKHAVKSLKAQEGCPQMCVSFSLVLISICVSPVSTALSQDRGPKKLLFRAKKHLLEHNLVMNLVMNYSPTKASIIHQHQGQIHKQIY